MSNKGNAAKVAKESQVFGELEMLTTDISILGEALETLAVRLTPVTRNDIIKGCETPEPPQLVVVAGRIREQHDRIRDMRDRVACMVECLEI